MLKGFYRVAAAMPEFVLADPRENAKRILALSRALAKQGVAVAVFPEMAVTGYTCGDLFEQARLREAAEAALAKIVAGTKGLPGVFIIGTPLYWKSRLFNAAAVVQNGSILAFVGKTYLPSYREFYEKRQFRPVTEHTGEAVSFAGAKDAPFGSDLVFEAPGFRFGVEICEDVWAVTPPSDNLALNGAEVIFNLSASPEAVGKAAFRRKLVEAQSARLLAGYVLSSSGTQESSSDLLFGGHGLIALNGRTLAETRCLEGGSASIVADLRPAWLESQRRNWSSFNDVPRRPVRTIAVGALPGSPDLKHFLIEPHPFVPADGAERAERCREILSIQSAALARRMVASHSQRLVLGLSGGLDSTLALLVCIRCCDLLRRPRRSVLAITMPGFGTSTLTRGNVGKLAEAVGVELREIPIGEAVKKHFADIGHDAKETNVVYENCQARERTQILMDVANGEHGIVVGTGDLSELALGWSTFNGDHMAMYGVNGGVPKTLVRAVIETYAASAPKALADVLASICGTAISPELIPGGQETEAIIGPYELHDFFLYYFIKYGETPEVLLLLAERVFKGRYPVEKIRWTLGVFMKRFFAQQFKRDTMPDGPKVGSIALSPRGDWRMPADVGGSLWLD